MPEALNVDTPPNGARPVEKMSYTKRIRLKAVVRVVVFTAIAATVFGAGYWWSTQPTVPADDPLFTLDGALPATFSADGETLLCNVWNGAALGVDAFDATSGSRKERVFNGVRQLYLAMPDGVFVANSMPTSLADASIDIVNPSVGVQTVPLAVTAAEFVAAVPQELQADAKAATSSSTVKGSVMGLSRGESPGTVRVRVAAQSFSFSATSLVILSADVDTTTGAVSNRSLSYMSGSNGTRPATFRFGAVAAADLRDFGIREDELPAATDATLRSFIRSRFAATVFTDNSETQTVHRARVWERVGDETVMISELVIPMSRGVFSSETPVSIAVSEDGTRLAIGTVGGPDGQATYVFEVE